MATLHILGDIKLTAGDGSVRFPTRQAEQIVKHLAMRVGEPVDREELATLCWPDAHPKSARNNLGVALHMIRRALAGAGLSPESTLLTNRQSVTLLLPKPEIDYWAAEPAKSAPPADDGLIGREPELKKLRDWQKEASEKLLSMVGPGGMGKTTLVRRLARDWPDPVAWVEMNGCSGPAIFLDRLGAAVALGPIAALDRLPTLLYDRRILIVLDACEQATCDVAGFIATLSAMPTVRVVTTSRVPLGLPRERIFRVQPLGPRDSVELLQRRLRRVLGPEFVPRTSYLEVIATGAEGVPLIIEAAARNWANGSLPSDAAEPSQSVEQTLLWSFNRATEAGVHVWRLLAVLAVPVPQEELTEMIGALGLIDGLRELIVLGVLHLETKGGIPVLRMLDTYRELALDRMGPDDLEAAMRGLAQSVSRWMRTQCRALRGEAPGPAVANLDLLLSDLSPIMAHAPMSDQVAILVDLFPYFYAGLVPQATYEWGSSLEERVVDPSTGLRLESILSFMERILFSRFTNERESRIREMRERGVGNESDWEVCRALIQLEIPAKGLERDTFWRGFGDHVQSNSRWVGNALHIEERRAIMRRSRRHGHTVLQIVLLGEIAFLLFYACRFSEMEVVARREAQLRRESNLIPSGALCFLGAAQCSMGQTEAGLAAFERHFQDERGRLRPVTQADLTNLWFSTAVSVGDGGTIERSREAVEEAWAGQDPLRREATIGVTETKMYRYQGDLERAKERMARVLRTFDDKPPTDYVGVEWAWLELALGHPDVARAPMSEGTAFALQRGNLLRGIPCLEGLLLTARERSDPEVCSLALGFLDAVRRRHSYLRHESITDLIRQYGLSVETQGARLEHLAAALPEFPEDQLSVVK